MLLLLYFKMDNGSNVCGVEFNYNNGSSSRTEYPDEDLKSIISPYLYESENEDIYNGQIFRQLFLGFEVVSEEGRSAFVIRYYLMLSGLIIVVV